MLYNLTPILPVSPFSSPSPLLHSCMYVNIRFVIIRLAIQSQWIPSRFRLKKKYKQYYRQISADIKKKKKKLKPVLLDPRGRRPRLIIYLSNLGPSLRFVIPSRKTKTSLWFHDFCHEILIVYGDKMRLFWCLINKFSSSLVWLNSKCDKLKWWYLNCCSWKK